MNVHNMTILAKVCHVKLKKKVSIYKEGMWSIEIRAIFVCLPMSDIV